MYNIRLLSIIFFIVHALFVIVHEILVKHKVQAVIFVKVHALLQIKVHTVFVKVHILYETEGTPSVRGSHKIQGGQMIYSTANQCMGWHSGSISILAHPHWKSCS